MKRSEVVKRFNQIERDILNTRFGPTNHTDVGICIFICKDSGEAAESGFIEYFRPTCEDKLFKHPVQNIDMNAFFLGPHQREEDATRRIIALHLFKEIVLDTKEYLNW